ncbi:MAG: response regulator [Symploca sp. SIO2E9]|nr:response regulator [Symploca sp. SIO2E9]
MKRILVIEDDAVTQKLLQELLESEGYEVIIASDGSLGANFATHFKPDLILCDISMPGFDGWQVLWFVKKFKVAAPLIFLSGKAAPDDIKKGIDMGASAYITKPYSRTELLGEIKNLLISNTQKTLNITPSSNQR